MNSRRFYGKFKYNETMKILFVVLISLFYRFAFVQNPLHAETHNMFYGGNCPEEDDTIKHPLNEPTRSAFYDSYFTNLTDNFGNNAETEATCSYVALAILLNYYDTTLNDNIVPENFEVMGISSSSSGTVYEADTGNPSLTVAEYYNYLRNNYKNTSLHAQLILKHKGALYSNPPSMGSTFLQEFGSNDGYMANLASSYLADLGISSHCTIVAGYTNTLSEYDDIWDDICYEIIHGRPVLVGFNNHAVVAYDCTTTSLTYHNGYKVSSAHPNLTSTKYLTTLKNENTLSTKRFGYVSLQFDYSHSHSFHYYDSNGDYCICGARHSHSYSYDYVDYNAVYHKSYCICGDYILEKHDYLIPGQTWLQYCSCGRHK